MFQTTLWCLLEGESGANGTGAILVQIAPFLLIMAIFFILVIRPQWRREKDRQAMLKELKKNDKVVTQTGLLGTVIQLKEPWVVLRIDDNKDVRVKVLLNSVSGMAPGTEKADESQKVR